ncbi:peptide chain release factor N(5)-glutamine methyltransferase [Pseudaminobacter arsenicus]|uniref:Release factor glutamine methyltransferase n=1 Tax=Borborobacter arsenicus TaxID=1851146 RepID=A0A432V6L5_9HYPH|nr:peptide chain release factor N(5)-glutamine methyltransferase [Pseudaminobacter arsenicus]RUM97779.1 peptide chain release factor N(5)-glutamine methyltransferase [Pseudaminobacter arsenicus]
MADPKGTLGGMLRQARDRLAACGADDPALDARLIVEHFSGSSRADAIARPEQALEASVVQAIEAAIVRREGGEPVHRILGFREFYGLKLELSPDTLEPRPDTETLVDMTLPFVRGVAAREGVCRILDLGTGTGAIALALLSQVENSMATGTDLAEGALLTAGKNAERLGLGARFSARKSNWFAEISGRFHLIVSNPPYIGTKEIDELRADVRNFDPLLALDGGADGLEAYRRIAAGSMRHLEGDGRIALEIGYDQKRLVTEIFAVAGFRLVEAGRDLAGNDRVLIFQR